ncbi:Uncharacterised protein [Vibrio cholerae]|nr:Uncharacterised protein [Vibrio cholerae]
MTNRWAAERLQDLSLSVERAESLQLSSARI